MASSLELADKALGGQLSERLRAMRAESVPYDEMARLLRLEGIDVSRETVRRWVKQLFPKQNVA